MYPFNDEIKMKNTDLHTHSYYSDGQISPKELVQLAKRKKIKYLALTDHNSVRGIKEAIQEGKKQKIKVIPAVEIRCNDAEILGYFIDINNRELIKKLKQNSKELESYVKEKCKRIRKQGYPISFTEIQKNFPKARGNINEFYYLWVLYKKGYGTMREISKKFKKIKSLKVKKPKLIPIVQAIRLIKKAGGVPVLAHPWLNSEKTLKKMNKLVKAGLKGIELNNGDAPPLRKRNMDKKIKAIAKKYNLILTSGSDYHGDERIPQMPGDHNLGHTNCNEKVIKELKKLAKN